jgi:hypothetical protein
MEIICLVMMRQLAMRYMALLLQTVFLLCSTLLAPGQNGSERLVTPSSIPTMPPVIVIGFVGGFVNHDNLVHSAVELAAQLRGDYPSGVYAEVFENRLREKAHREILRLLDTNHDGTVSAEEKQNAHIIIYGMSWGGSETVALARELEKENIPVALTIQVDSISKIGQSDAVIPANVAEAVNFYQADGLLHGQAKIRAADAAHTRIIGNFRFDYKANPIKCDKYPWYDRVFATSHTEIECDPSVWKQVESLIRAKLPPVTPSRLLPRSHQ